MGRLAGVLWLASIAMVLAALAIVIAYDVEPLAPDIGSALEKIAARAPAHIVELVFDTASGLLLLAVAPPLYLLFVRYGQAQVLIAVTLIAAAGMMIAIHNMANLTLAQVSQAYVAAPLADKTAWLAAGVALIHAGKWGVSIFSATLLFGVIVLANVLVRAGAAPMIGWVGLATAALGFVGIFPGRIDPDYAPVGYVLYLPFLVWQVWFGIWLLGRRLTEGKAQSPILS